MRTFVSRRRPSAREELANSSKVGTFYRKPALNAEFSSKQPNSLRQNHLRRYQSATLRNLHVPLWSDVLMMGTV
jgi:hypothetical protein